MAFRLIFASREYFLLTDWNDIIFFVFSNEYNCWYYYTVYFLVIGEATSWDQPESLKDQGCFFLNDCLYYPSCRCFVLYMLRDLKENKTVLHFQLHSLRYKINQLSTKKGKTKCRWCQNCTITFANIMFCQINNVHYAVTRLTCGYVNSPVTFQALISALVLSIINSSIEHVVMLHCL
jgi:hypothetical protein